MNRYSKFDTRFLLANVNETIAYMLPAHANNVAASLTGVKKQCQCEPRPCSRAMAFFKLIDLGFCPGMIAVRFQIRQFYSSRRVVRSKPMLDRIVHQGPDCLKPMARGKPLLRFQQRNDVLALEGRYTLVAVIATETLQDTP